MKRRALLLAAASCACRGSQLGPWTFALGVLGVANSGAAEQRWVMGELAHIAERARRHATARSALSDVLFDELGFTREVTSTELGFVLLPSVLRRRRGSCVGLGTLYLALAEALGFAASGVLMPGHFYVRQRRPGPPHNVELLRRGEAMPDSWYRERYPVPQSGTQSPYARPLSEREVLGVVEYDVGNERRRQGQLDAARRAFARASQLLPDFSQAHASLGATQHLLRDYAGAIASYRAARRLEPQLPGLQQNLELLRAETGLSID